MSRGAGSLLALLALACCGAWGEGGGERVAAASRETGSAEAGAAGAPAASGTVVPLRPLPVAPGAVYAVHLAAGERWLGFRGAGIWAGSRGEEGRRWGLGEGLRSGVVRFLAVDSGSGRACAGTDRGLMVLEPGSDRWRPLAALRAEASLGFPALAARAGPGAIASDGTLFFQLEGEPDLEAGPAPTAFFDLRRDTLSRWRPPAALALVGMTALSFDETSGCWLIGGATASGAGAPTPAVALRCGDELSGSRLAAAAGSAAGTPVRVSALAREPLGGALVAALEVRSPTERSEFGLYRVDPQQGEIVPIAPALRSSAAEITALAADRRRGRLLVATFGEGLWEVRGDTALRLEAPGLGEEITSLAVEPASGAVVVGTTGGAFELPGDGSAVTPLGPPADAGLPGDARPVDVDRESGRLLLSSPSAGLLELAREETAGGWPVVRRWRAGDELPEGRFGDAAYTRRGLAVVVDNRGLALLANRSAAAEPARVLGPDDGLAGRQVLRLLVRRSGHVWLAFPPSPVARGAPLQVLDGRRVVRTFERADRNVATIGGWVEMAERGTVFAATRAGVVEVADDGALTRLSRHAASAIARQPGGGALGVVGSTIEVWDGRRFAPVLFALEHPELGRVTPGSPRDLAIGADGWWYVLYADGLLAVLDGERRFRGLLGPEDGIPPTARRLLAHPHGGEVFVGSALEGVVVVGPGG